MLSWEADILEICKVIRSNNSPLKIVLKIQDDFEMFDEFYDHHCKIVGSKNIYVFDNGSTNEDLLSRYSRFGSGEYVFSFGGFHNDLHSPKKFPELYSALKDSSTHYVFLDSDERMCLIDEKGWAVDEKIVDYLDAIKDFSIPGNWLSNATGSKSVFNIPIEQDELLKGINWGKPILSASESVEGYLNHNIQAIKYVKKGLMYRNIFILHLNHLSPKQRINANIRKLVARGFVPKGATPEDVINARQASYADQNIGFYVDEIKVLHTNPPKLSTNLLSGQMLLSDMGRIVFFSDIEKNYMSRFIRNSSTFACFVENKNSIFLASLESIDLNKELVFYKGHVDSIAGGRISGWAVDEAGNDCLIRLIVDGIERMIIRTVLDRPDLSKAGISKGKGGFNVNLKGTLVNGVHSAQLLFSNGEPLQGGCFFVET